MAREIDEAWIEEAIERYRRIEALRAEFDKAAAAVEVTVHSPDGLVEVVVTAAGDDHRRAHRRHAAAAAAARAVPVGAGGGHRRGRRGALGAGEAARRDVRRLPAAGGRSDDGDAARRSPAGFDEAATALTAAAARAGRRRSPPAGAFGADAPGRLGEVGRALHRQWLAALGGAGPGGGRRRRPAGRRGRRAARAPPPATPRRTRPPAGARRGARDGRARPAAPARPPTCSTGSTHCSPPAARPRITRSGRCCAASAPCPATRPAPSPGSGPRRWPPPGRRCTASSRCTRTRARRSRTPARGRGAGAEVVRRRTGRPSPRTSARWPASSPPTEGYSAAVAEWMRGEPRGAGPRAGRVLGSREAVTVTVEPRGVPAAVAAAEIGARVLGAVDVAYERAGGAPAPLGGRPGGAALPAAGHRARRIRADDPSLSRHRSPPMATASRSGAVVLSHCSGCDAVALSCTPRRSVDIPLNADVRRLSWAPSRNHP